MDLIITTPIVRLNIGPDKDIGSQRLVDGTGKSLESMTKGDLLLGRVTRLADGTASVEIFNRTIPMELGQEFTDGTLVTFRIKSIQGNILELELVKPLQADGVQFQELMLNSLTNLLGIDSKSIFEYFSNKHENLSSLETIFKVLSQVLDRERSFESFIFGSFLESNKLSDPSVVLKSLNEEISGRIKQVFEELADNFPIVKGSDFRNTSALLERLVSNGQTGTKTYLSLTEEIKTTLEDKIQLTFGERLASNVIKLVESLLQKEGLSFEQSGGTSSNFDRQLKLYFSVSDLLRSQKQSELLIDYLSSAVENIRDDNLLVAVFSSLKGFVNIQESIKTDQVTEKMFALIEKLYGQLSEAKDFQIGSLEIKQILSEFVSAMKNAFGDNITLKEGVTDNLLPALRQLEQFIQTQDTLNKLNPVMNALGDPSWMLIPVLLNNKMNIWNVSNSETQNKDQSNRRKRSKNRINMNLALPGLGDIEVVVNYGGIQAEVDIVVDSEDKSKFLTNLLPQLTTSIQKIGYPQVECNSHHSSHFSDVDQQVKLYFEKSIIA